MECAFVVVQGKAQRRVNSGSIARSCNAAMRRHKRAIRLVAAFTQPVNRPWARFFNQLIGLRPTRSGQLRNLAWKLHQSITGKFVEAVTHAANLRNTDIHRGHALSLACDLSGPSLVQARLHLLFTQTIAMAMLFAPEQRPSAPGRRDHPGYWCNFQVESL